MTSPRQASARSTIDYDLIIVGGGIYGATLSLEATRRNWRTLLIERDEIGQATSANSFRILHGGLRYLQTLDLRRFQDSVRERSWFLREFPRVVKPQGFLMPIYNRGLKRRSVLRLALTINDFLSRKRNDGIPPERRILGSRLISAAETKQLFPEAPSAGLRGGAIWHDAVMLAPQDIMKTLVEQACISGAAYSPYTSATRLLVNGRDVIGVEAVNRKDDAYVSYKSPRVVNCAGPWCREVAKAFDRDLPQLFRPAMGFNLLLDRPPVSGMGVAVFPRTASSQALFLMPQDDRLFAGTFYLPCNQLSEKPAATQSQIHAFMMQLNDAVPSLNLKPRDVLRVEAGFLPARRPGSTRISRRPVILDHGACGGPRGMFSVSGVKFTTARSVAERTLECIDCGR